MEALAERRRASAWRLRRLRRLNRRAQRLRLRGANAADATRKRPHEEEDSSKLASPPKRRQVLPPPPERRTGEEGESSRIEAGLELVGEIAPAELAWTYPVVDERWRCFAGYLPRALRAPEAPRFFELVRKGTKWLQPKGRWGPLPLRTAWMTNKTCTCRYRYGGAEVPPEPYPDWMQEILAACMPLCGLTRPTEWPNSCNLNLYIDGQHSVGWHADNESLFQGKAKDCRIISLSLGQTRRFELQSKGSLVHRLDLSDGDLCTMEGMMQKYYTHRVPKDNARGIKERINLTWRWVVAHNPDCAAATSGSGMAAAAAAA